LTTTGYDGYDSVRGALVSDDDALAIVGVRGYEGGPICRSVSVLDLHVLKERLCHAVLNERTACSRDTVYAHDANTILVTHVLRHRLIIEQLDLREADNNSSGGGGGGRTTPSARVLSIVDAHTSRPFVPSNFAAAAAALRSHIPQGNSTTTTTEDVATLQRAALQTLRPCDARSDLERAHLFNVENTSLASSGGGASYCVGVVGVDHSTFSRDAGPARVDQNAVYHTVAWVGSVDLRNLLASQRKDMCRTPIRSNPFGDSQLCTDVCVVKQF
jgi:hypothetical protein